jgi:signal peptidase I
MARKKDYGAKAIKWKKRKARIKFFVRIGIPVLLFIGLILFFLFDFTLVRDNTLRTSLLKGDIVLLNKISYGPYSLNNLPFTDFPIYSKRIFKISGPEIGDVIAIQQFYTDSVTQNEYVHNHFKNCIGTPGDIFEIQDTALLVNGFPTYLDVFETPDSLADSLDFNIINFQATLGKEKFEKISIPSEGTEIFLSPENFKFWKLLMEAENPGMIVTSENGKVFVNGSRMSYYTFKNDFYVVSGFAQNSQEKKISWSIVPFGNITGKAEIICFSFGSFADIQNIQDFFSRIRWSRMFKFTK